jgi:PucR C-terminal helix-turn-helix domain/GGDEF-like domain
MEPTWDAARAPSAQEAWRDVLQPLGEELRREAQSLSEQAIVRIIELVPAAFADPMSDEQVRANCEAAYVAFGLSLETGSDPMGLELPPSIVAGARSRAQRGFPLPSLLRGFRLAHRSVADWATTQISSRAAVVQQREALRLCSAWLFVAIDRMATLYTEAYTTERERWYRSAAAIRAATIERVLAGEERESGPASTRLGYQLDRHHIGLLAWIGPSSDAEAGHELLDAEIERFAALTGAETALVDPIGVLAARAWIGRVKPFDDATLDAPPRTAREVSIAFGEPATGLEGFRRSHVEATHARRVAAMLGRSGGAVTRYRDVELVAIATIDLERSRGFVQRALGELLHDDDATLRIVSTLRVYLEENRSRTRAARRLRIHENTISYRIRQAEDILGGSVDSNALNLSVALALLPSVRDLG